MADDETNLPAPPSPDQGVSFGHFLVPKRADGSLWELGRGSMGVTYRAFDTSLRIEVALKVITADRVSDSNMRRRFQREARAAAKIRHPNVASVLYLGEQSGEFFYAMEFITGRSLSSVIKSEGGRLPLASAVALGGQAAAGLNAAHRREVVHRDLKPANLMLLEGDASDHEDERTAAAGGRQLKIIDFGLARSFGGARQEDSMVTQSFSGFIGTPTYASPEQCSGEGDLDGRSDLYSLGVILWEMLSGTLPFTGRIIEVLGKHQFQAPPFERLAEAGVPEPLIEVLRGLLVKAPGGRSPQTAGELRTILDNVLRDLVSGLPVAAAPLVAPASRGVEESSDSTTTPMVGTTLLSRYRLGAMAGMGDGGRLFLAADNKEAGLRVGLKLLSPNRLANPVFTARLETAIERAREFPHPAVLAHSSGVQRSGGATFYVREWAEGFSLLALLENRKSLRAAEVRLLLAGLPAALDHAVQAGYPLLEVALRKLFVVPVASQGEAYGDWLGLRSLSVEEWPDFALKLNALGFLPAKPTEYVPPLDATILDDSNRDEPPVDATRLIHRPEVNRIKLASHESSADTNRFVPPAASEATVEMTDEEANSATGNVVAAFARLIRELLGGQPDSLAPLSALDGEGNAVLRRALALNGSPAAYPSAADFAAKFFAAIGETTNRAALTGRSKAEVETRPAPAFPPGKIALLLACAILPLMAIIAWLALRQTPAGKTEAKPSLQAETGVPTAPPQANAVAVTPLPAPSLPPTPASTPLPPPAPTPLATPMPSLTPQLTVAPAPTVAVPAVPAARSTGPARYRGELRDSSAKNILFPITVDLDADRNGGAITYSNRLGDTKVRFTAISKESEMHAVTKEVVTKPARIKWDGEVFNLHFSSDESQVDYTCEYPQPNLRGTLKLQPTPAR